MRFQIFVHLFLQLYAQLYFFIEHLSKLPICLGQLIEIRSQLLLVLVELIHLVAVLGVLTIHHVLVLGANLGDQHIVVSGAAILEQHRVDFPDGAEERVFVRRVVQALVKHFVEAD